LGKVEKKRKYLLNILQINNEKFPCKSKPKPKNTAQSWEVLLELAVVKQRQSFINFLLRVFLLLGFVFPGKGGAWRETRGREEGRA